MRSCRLKITHIFACGCFRKFPILEKLHIFNSIAYRVRSSPISVYLNIKEFKYVWKMGYGQFATDTSLHEHFATWTEPCCEQGHIEIQ